MNRIRRICRCLAGLPRRARALLASAAAAPAVLAAAPPLPPGWNKTRRCPPTLTPWPPAACPAGRSP
jgi:hypothetical protein